ncbi:hypothetical protein Bca101_024224 [Brassica carinata]
MDLTEPNLPSHPSVELNDVLLVEGNPNLVVTSTITVVMGPQPGWGVWSDGETADKEPVQLHKKHTVSRKRKESEPNPKKASLKKVSPKKQRRTHSPTNEWLQAKVTELEVKVTVLNGRVMTLEATIEQIKEKLKRKRRRSRAGSSFPVFAVKNRRRRTLQTTEHTDHPDHDHHASSNSAQSEQPGNNFLCTTTYSPNHSPNSPSHKTPVPSFEYHNSTIPNLQDHNSAKSKSADQASSAHPSLVHPSSDHTPTDHTSPTHETSAPKSPEHYSTNLSSPDHRSPSQNSPPPSSPTNILPHHPQLVITTHTSPTHCSATQASLFLQGMQQYQKLIAESPLRFFSISLSRIFPTTIYPLPALTTTPTSVSNKSACFSQGFSPHYSATNAFAVTATRKGSPSMIQPTKRLLIDVDERSKDPDNELSDESAEQKIQRVVDELDMFLHAQTRGKEVHELSDSSPAKKKTTSFSRRRGKDPCPSTYRLRDFPPLSPDRISSRGSVGTFFNNVVSTTKCHMTVLMHMLGERHKDMLQMDKATFTPSALTSLMMSKERQFHAAVMKDKIHWDPRLKKLILVPDKTLIRDVCTVYTPMIWADKHWMGLCINLVMGHVIRTSPVTYHLLHGSTPPNTYEKLRSGDCSPVSVKFMEMHLYYDPHPHMFGITDHNVDKFRQFYAMEAYKTIVLPVYH